MNWFNMPSPFPEITTWGCIRGPWNYVLSHNADRNDWGASVTRYQPVRNGPRLDLGWHFANRAEAEAAIDQHYRSTAR